MIDLALDPSETRPRSRPVAPDARGLNLRVVLLGFAGAGALCGFGVAASTLMAGLAAPPPVRIVAAGRAAEWPDLKDGLPALAGAQAQPQPAAPKRAEPETPPLRMTAMPDPVTAPQAATSPALVVVRPSAAAPEPPAKRIPTPTPVVLIGPARQAATLAPARTALLQPPRASETVRARDVAEPTAPPLPMPAAATPAQAPASAAAQEKPQRKPVAARKAPNAGKVADKSGATPAAVAQSESPEPEETEVLGIKVPSLAPAGRKLKEGVDALGEAVRNVF